MYLLLTTLALFLSPINGQTLITCAESQQTTLTGCEGIDPSTIVGGCGCTCTETSIGSNMCADVGGQDGVCIDDNTNCLTTAAPVTTGAATTSSGTTAAPGTTVGVTTSGAPCICITTPCIGSSSSDSDSNETDSSSSGPCSSSSSSSSESSSNDTDSSSSEGSGSSVICICSGSSSNSSSSSSSEETSSEEVINFAALGELNNNDETNVINDNDAIKEENIVVNVSDYTWNHIWGIVGLVIFVNVFMVCICWCRNRNKRKNKIKLVRDDKDESRIDVLF